jgi:pyrimidine operon attenuation protein/uracil phosphoribosyltransferase
MAQSAPGGRRSIKLFSLFAVSLAQVAFLFPMPYPKEILNSITLNRALDRIAHEIGEKNERGEQVVLVGVQRGGVYLAARLRAGLEKIWCHTIPLGLLDVSMHRDDHSERLPQNIQPTNIPFDLTGKTVVLVDDVLFSGRTVRAALDALTDLGRPRAIQLAVLIDRGNRELPIKADFVGKTIPTTLQERVDVHLRENGSEADGVTLLKA